MCGSQDMSVLRCGRGSKRSAHLVNGISFFSVNAVPNPWQALAQASQSLGPADTLFPRIAVYNDPVAIAPVGSEEFHDVELMAMVEVLDHQTAAKLRQVWRVLRSRAG